MPSLSDVKRWLSSIAASLCLLGACIAAAPYAPVAPLVAYVFGFACVVGSALLAAATAPAFEPRELVAPVSCAVITLVAVRLGEPGQSVSALAVAAALLVLGSALGSAVGSGIEHPGHLFFVAIVSALADTFSVAHPEGPSAAIASSPVALSLFAVSWPMLGTRGIEPMLGGGDVVFAALYVAAGRKHGLPAQRTLLALVLAFVATMLAVVVTELPVPALPFLGISMLVAHPAARRPPEKDRARGLAVVCGLALLLAGVMVRRFF
jgi:hypothetical protein